MSTPLRWSFFIFLHLFLTVRDTLNNNIDRKRSQLSQLQRQLSELESNVHDLKSQKVKWFAENPSLEKRWWLYIFPQYRAIKTQSIRHKESHIFAIFPLY